MGLLLSLKESKSAICFVSMTSYENQLDVGFFSKLGILGTFVSAGQGIITIRKKRNDEDKLTTMNSVYLL